MLKLFFYVLLVFLQSPVIQDINKDQVNSLINDKVTVIDLRTEKEFENGTKSIANLLSDMKDQNIDTIVGGGDSASAIRKFSDIENITHVSTGGGASLELLGGKSLPAITALEKL